MLVIKMDEKVKADYDSLEPLHKYHADRFIQNLAKLQRAEKRLERQIARSEDQYYKNEMKRGIACSFCGKDKDEVKRIIAGEGVYICNECIDLCTEILSEDATDSKEATPTSTARKNQATSGSDKKGKK